MPPSKIMIIRHAEKPSEQEARGVDGDGRIDDEALSVQGWQRAGALVRFFAPLRKDEALLISRPAHLFAIKVDPSRDPKSKRPKLTLSPLSMALDLPVGQHHAKGEERALVADVMERPGVVLIAWAHSRIVEIAEAIRSSSEGLPSKWPEERFDMVWVFDRDGDHWSFNQVPQQLLAGDDAEVGTRATGSN